ncbi:band 7 protein [Desulfatibacillum aliphaticivorans]|uniref:Band 7 protein n=1 Tax=Desulfatibacillum aliphaticivorans TaxID=218208 RepID=B8FFG4_DESAL|nr:SPFH domain-containing protein [Desulfatibacillum aliphaticivorans]ACL04224.1 band 7 protein [Desulfatibacillum aliphaticivorans]
MGLWKKLTGEFVDIVEWLDDTNDTLVFRFERYGNEIKYGAKLVVREGQQAVFINEGQIADVFTPGTYTLETRNLPILSTLKGWKHGFESPFKAEVYFCSTRQFTDIKWGTPGPVTMRDKEFGAVRVTAYGIFSMRIKDPATFIREIVGTDGNFSTSEISSNLRGKIGMRIKEVMPETGIPILDLEGKVMMLGEMLVDRINPSFKEFGLQLTEVQVQDLGLPEEVERAIDKGGAMRAIGNMQAYTQYETASSIKDAAQNPSGTAGAGIGMGMGFSMANQMAGAMGQGQQPQQQAPQQAGPGVPPPIPQAVQFYVAVGGQQTGPFDLAVIQQQIQAGQVAKDALVWKQGMAAWTAAGEVPELAGFFGAMPPPLPPQPPQG